MSKNIKKVMSILEIRQEKLDLNDLAVIDSFSLSKSDYSKGILISIIFSIIAIMIYFVPVNINGKTDMVFGLIYGTIKSASGVVGLWAITLMTVATGILSIYGKWIAKRGKIYDYFSGDSNFHPIIYLTGGFFAITYTLSATLGVRFPEIIVGPNTGGSIIPGTMVSVFWIILVGAGTMPFLLNYGLVDFVGSLLEPFMRPIWKVPGRAAVNAIASFVSSSSVGVLITSKLYKEGVYTEKEAVLVVTGFSAVSIGFAYVVIETAGLEKQFIPIYFSGLVLTLLVSAVIARLPPLNKKKDVYPDGRVQTAEDRKGKSSSSGVIAAGLERASKKAITAPNLVNEVLSGLKDGFGVIPKVVTTLAAVAVASMILAETTPVFTILGKGFEPLLNLLRVPDAAMIAPSFPVGLAEMFLPVLLIAEKIDLIAPGARYLVVVVSIVQIIFFSETIVVMMSQKLPIKLWELVVVFFERTILAIIFGAGLMHLMF